MNNHTEKQVIEQTEKTLQNLIKKLELRLKVTEIATIEANEIRKEIQKLKEGK
jgi:predicted kinase